MDILDFTGKVVLVTGGARGVGRGITQSFLDRGATVVICGRNPPETASSGKGGEAQFVKADVRDATQVEAMVAEIEQRFGRLDVVINNAGGAPPSDPSTVSPLFSESIIKLNLLAPLFVSQATWRSVSAGTPLLAVNTFHCPALKRIRLIPETCHQTEPSPSVVSWARRSANRCTSFRGVPSASSIIAMRRSHNQVSGM